MADFNKPNISSLYVDYTDEINGKFADLAKGLDPANTTATNIPTNAIRWVSANNRWEKFNGSSWNPLSTTYAITVAYTPSGSISATTVQGAIAELDGDITGLASAKYDKTGGAISGNVSVSGTLTVTGSTTVGRLVAAAVSTDNFSNLSVGSMNIVGNTTVGYPAFGYNINSGNAADTWRYAGADHASWIQYLGQTIRFFVSTGTPAAGGIIAKQQVVTVDVNGIITNGRVIANASVGTDIEVAAGTNSGARIAIIRPSTGHVGLANYKNDGGFDKWLLGSTVNGSGVLTQLSMSVPLFNSAVVYSEGFRVPKTTVSTGNPSGGTDGDVWAKVV